MTILPSPTLRPLPHPPYMLPLRHLRRRLLRPTLASASTATWTPAPLTLIRPATADSSLFHVTISLTPDLAAAHTAAGQYLQLRVPDAGDLKPAFLAIASPPQLAATEGVFQFLVKTVPGTTAEVVCGMGSGGVVEVGAVMGKGFNVARLAKEKVDTVFIFATGSGISPIHSLIESGFSADKGADVWLYYGARNLQRMAYQDKFKDWESSGVRIVPVLSQPDDKWKGERGYVQAAFSRAKSLLSPTSTGAVLCGHKQMTEDITSLLVADGVSKDVILMNF